MLVLLHKAGVVVLHSLNISIVVSLSKVVASQPKHFQTKDDAVRVAPSSVFASMLSKPTEKLGNASSFLAKLKSLRHHFMGDHLLLSKQQRHVKVAVL